MTTRLPLQLTLALIKPDAVCMPHVMFAANRAIQQGWFVIKSKEMQLSKARAEEFYKEHKERFFYNRLITFMSSNPLQAYILAGYDAIDEFRYLIGPTKVCMSCLEDPDTLRGMYGLTDTRNIAHGSDSPKSAFREIPFFFPEFNIDKWYKHDEPAFRDGFSEYCNKKQIHVLPSSYMEYMLSEKNVIPSTENLTEIISNEKNVSPSTENLSEIITN